jgi:toxin ParE1/3/4
VRYKVAFAPEARDDLRNIYLHISGQAGRERAMAYLARIEAFCDGFRDFPMRGSSRDDLFSGLRIVGFERRVTVAFHIDGDRVVFDRFLYGGRTADAV